MLLKHTARAAHALVMFISRNRSKLAKWLAAGIAFTGISTGLLYILVDRSKLSVPLSTFLAAELGTLLRFFVNHYWVFGLRNPTVRSCVQYHVANAGSFALWWSIANLLAISGMHYLLASVVAAAVSMLFSLATNFFWIWKTQHPDQ